jgi:hypothetical protein
MVGDETTKNNSEVEVEAEFGAVAKADQKK